MPDRPYRADLPAHRLARSATCANSNWASLSAPGPAPVWLCPGPPKRRAVPLFCPATPIQLSSWPTRTLTRFRRPPAASSGSRPPPSRARQRGGRTAQRLRRANSANLRHCFFARWLQHILTLSCARWSEVTGSPAAAAERPCQPRSRYLMLGRGGYLRPFQRWHTAGCT